MKDMPHYKDMNSTFAVTCVDDSPVEGSLSQLTKGKTYRQYDAPRARENLLAERISAERVFVTAEFWYIYDGEAFKGGWYRRRFVLVSGDAS